MNKSLSFTTRYENKSNILVSEVGISEASRNTPKLKGGGIWDTGATSSVITKGFAEKVGLKPVGKTNTKGVHGIKTVNRYLINLYLPNSLVIRGLPVSECETLNNAQCAMLLGMDVIGLGDFAVTNYNAITAFSFRFPSVGEIDFNEVPVKKPYIAEATQPRNSKCNCGSGKKYKQCCGKK